MRSRQCDEPLRSESPAAVAEQGSQDSLPEWSKGVDSSSTSASCVGSNPIAARCLFRSSRFAAIRSGIDRRHWWPSDTEGIRTPAAEPNGFLAHHLNHSVTVSCHEDKSSLRGRQQDSFFLLKGKIVGWLASVSEKPPS